MSDKFWKRMDQVQSYPYYFRKEDCERCCYAREYTPHAGYKHSADNNAVFNFKKPNRERGKYSWRYKIENIEQFANDFHMLFKNRRFSFSVIPPSKKRDHPEYDSRMEDVVKRLLALGNTNYHYHEPIVTIDNVDSCSQEYGTRDPDLIAKNYKWVGFGQAIPESIVVIDDVISTGGHFIAYQNLILDNHPNMIIYGAFWAKTV